MSSKNPLLLIAVFLLVPLYSWSAATTVINSGNWSSASTWSGGNIANDISETVSFDNNVGEVVIQGSQTFVTSQIVMNNGSLTVGASGIVQNISTGNGTTININGNVVVWWGSLIMGNNLKLNVSGSMKIKGGLTIGNNGVLSIAGSGVVQVDGIFTAGTNTAVNVDGNLNVHGTYTAGNGSAMTGSGTARG